MQSSSDFSSLSIILRAVTSSLGLFRTVANVLKSVNPSCFSNLLERSFTASKYSFSKSLSLVLLWPSLCNSKSKSSLEFSRDDLLFELHRLGHNNTRDRDLLKEYFEAVNDLSSKLEKQLGFTLLRTFATVRKSPRELVTALRIIEREEKSDEDCMAKQKQTGFLPPGRPKKWREVCMDKLADSVEQKMEGNQLEGRGENKMWLVRHLEVIRMLMLE